MANSAPDYYKTLGVSKDATPEEIKKAFRRLARKHHPDAGGSEETFKEINEAYEVLGDEKKRAMYDQFGAAGPGHMPYGAGGAPGGFSSWQDILESLRNGEGAFGKGWKVNFDFGGQPGAQGAGPGAGGPFGGNPFGFGGGPQYVDMSDFMQGGGFGGQPVPRKGQSMNVSLDVSFDDAFRGAEKTISLKRPDTGTVETLKVKIPAGAEDGARLRYRGKGGPGINGGPAGDITVTLKVKSNDLFSRKGADVLIEAPVTFAELAMGEEIVVPAPDGTRVKVRIPAGTQPDSVLSVKDKGAPITKGSSLADKVRGKGKKACGSLRIKLKLVVPNKLNSKQKAALKEYSEATTEKVRSW